MVALAPSFGSLSVQLWSTLMRQQKGPHVKIGILVTCRSSHSIVALRIQFPHCWSSNGSQRELLAGPSDFLRTRSSIAANPADGAGLLEVIPGLSKAVFC
eukprot:3225233-Amphidinium_carterae.1